MNWERIGTVFIHYVDAGDTSLHGIHESYKLADSHAMSPYRIIVALHSGGSALQIGSIMPPAEQLQSGKS